MSMDIDEMTFSDHRESARRRNHNRSARPHHDVITDDDDHDGGGGNCCTRCCRDCCSCFRSSLLTIFMFLATGAGIGVGIALRHVAPFDKPETNPRPLLYLAFVVELKIRFMKFIVVPLIVFSLVAGIGSLRSAASGKIGLRMLCYYLCTTILAVGEGVGFVYAVRPGIRGDVTVVPPPRGDVIGDSTSPDWPSNIDGLLDIFRNIIPDNFVTVAFEMTQSKSTTKEVSVGNNETVTVEYPELQSFQNMNILGITFFSMVFGFGLARLGNKGRIAQLFFENMADATLNIMKGVFWLYPLTIFLMMTQTVIQLTDPLQQLLGVFMFMATVLLGLFVHSCLVLPLVYVVVTRRNPFKHVYWCFRALLTAFATNNSNLTLPVTMDCLQLAGVRRPVLRMMCPIGATINMDGLALYEAVACIYVATLVGRQLGPVEVISMAFTAVGVSIGAPAMGGGLASFIVLFSTIGLPLNYIFILLPFDWLLARFRTVTNVWGDCVGAGIVDKWSRRDIDTVGYAERAEDAGSLDHGHPDGAVLTGYMPRHPRDWTVRLVNERGDKLVVSKV